MGLIKIKKGLDLPIAGQPDHTLSNGHEVTRVALLGEDYPGMKPTMEVQVGDSVIKGQVLFTDKKNPGVKFVAPGTGEVVEINRAEKRAFKSLVIKLSGSDETTFDTVKENEISNTDLEKIKSLLNDTGLWTSFRTRPFSKVAPLDGSPASIFVNAMDTNPLAPSIEKIIDGNEKAIEFGLKIVAKLTEGKVFLCKSPNTNIKLSSIEKVNVEEFDGPHPAGNAGTHIHFLDPVSSAKMVWYIGIQDVIAIGKTFDSGKLYTDRIISIAGPSVKSPRLLKTRMGASLLELTIGELVKGKNRIVSGSVINGREATEVEGFLGKYHQSVAALSNVNDRKLLGWMLPGTDKFSVTRAFVSSLFGKKKFNFNSGTNGQERAIVPIGSYEKVMPLDILPTFLLRSLAVDDVEEAEKLGCLELDEEDLALCTYVCPSKIDHGVNLRRNLTLIEKEG